MNPRREVDAFLALMDARENLRDAHARHEHAVNLAGMDMTRDAVLRCDRTAGDIARAAEVLRDKVAAWCAVVGIADAQGGEGVAA